MCLFGLGCCSEKLREVTISLLCCTEYQRIHPAETEPFDLWPLQTYIQWKQSLVEIAQVDVWARWNKLALHKTSSALYFSQLCIVSKQIQNILHVRNIDKPANVCKIRTRNTPTFNFVVPRGSPISDYCTIDESIWDWPGETQWPGKQSKDWWEWGTRQKALGVLAPTLPRMRIRQTHSAR